MKDVDGNERSGIIRDFFKYKINRFWSWIGYEGQKRGELRRHK